MNNTNILIGVSLILCSNVVAGISQILLKKSAGRTYSSWLRSYLNPYVITSYGLLFGTTILGVLALRYIPLVLSAAFAASGQIIVPLLSYIFLKEKICKKRLIGMAIIVIGIFIFSL